MVTRRRGCPARPPAVGRAGHRSDADLVRLL